MLNRMKAFFNGLKSLWNPPQETWLVRFLCLFMLLGFIFWAAGSYLLISKTLHGHEEHADHHSESATEFDTSMEVQLGGSHIPKDILARQDGKEELGADLKESALDSGRDIASILQKDGLDVSVGSYFSSVGGIVSGIKRPGSNDIVGVVEAEVGFEVDSRVAMEEIQARNTEFRATLASVFSEYSKDDILSIQGKLLIKTKIMSEINFRLGAGRVTDVLFSEFKVR